MSYVNELGREKRTGCGGICCNELEERATTGSVPTDAIKRLYSPHKRVVKKGRRKAIKRKIAKEQISPEAAEAWYPATVVFEEDEYIDDYETVRTGWKQRKHYEKSHPGRPVRARLQPDE